MSVPDISPTQLAQQLREDAPPFILDVREPWELELARLQNTIDIPMNQVPGHVDEIRDQIGSRDLIVMCHSGVRSAAVVGFLQRNGFDHVINLTGGIHAWSEQIDSNVPTY